MTDTAQPPEQQIAEAKQRRHYFSAIWIIPIIAMLIAGYLAVRSYAEHGSTITISFRSAEGLTAGQTAVKYKYVTLGTVEKITLKHDRSGVIANIRMNADTQDILTDHAHFWVEKPRLGSNALSDIVSGTYIQVDPGAPGGTFQTDFVGLEDKPALPADEPGTSYALNASRIGAVNEESPVYFRDINVGKVLGYDVGSDLDTVVVHVFVRAPYDKFVKPDTRFWNASGLSVKFGGGGLHLEMQSVLSLLNGSIAFDTPVQDMKEAQADTKTAFQLYPSQKIAQSAPYGKQLTCVTYVKSSIKDLAPGSPVQIFGIDVGEVTNVKLALDPQKESAQVRVTFEIDPERAFGTDAPADAQMSLQHLVQNGMRVKVGTSDLVLGQEVVSLEFAPETDHADIASEGDAMVLPGQGGGTDNVAGALADIAAKLDQIPFDSIGQHLDHLLTSADQTISGPELHQAIHALAVTLANAQQVSEEAKKNLTPAMQKLPDISSQLQTAVTQANAFMTSVNQGYGQDSEFQRDSQRVLSESSEAARSIRLLADYLEHHPEALLQGKTLDKGKP